MEDVDIQDLTGFYKGAKVKFDEDEDFKKVSQTNVVKLQAGDEGCKAIWQVLCDVSRKEFEKVGLCGEREVGREAKEGPI
jgi:arginyl-tRNA synthetase